MMEKQNIRIEEVGDINFDYPYLEVFYKNSNKPFLDIGITSEKELNFKFYPFDVELELTMGDLEKILNTAKDFLPQALKNEDDFLNWNEK